MAFTAKGSDRLSFGALYVLVALITLWGGFRLVNHSFEVRFLKDYLLQWETRLNAFAANQGVWPVFDGSNHGQYMARLSQKMSLAGISLPHSNSGAPYRYRVERFGGPAEDVFLLCLHDRLILFGLSEKTIRKLDQSIDGHSDLTLGKVSGRKGKSGENYIGQVRL